MFFLRKIKRLFLVFFTVFWTFSCSSIKNIDSKSKSKSETSKQNTFSDSKNKSENKGKKAGLRPLPAKITEIPLYDFSENYLKIESENMYYENFNLIEDEKASNFFALKLLNDSSCAVAKINFPQGSYSGLANIFSPASNHSRFFICVDDDSYLVYGSEPPVDKYELTTRSVVSFTLENPKTVTVRLQQNDSKGFQNGGQTGMSIDYILFRKAD